MSAVRNSLGTLVSAHDLLQILVSREMETGSKRCSNIGWILYSPEALVGLILRRAALTLSVVKL